MNIEHLRNFLVLAETLHFGRTAELLHMTQPPLSRQIAALEKELGTLLFDRHSRSVALTPAGRNFQQNITRLLDDYDFAVRSAQAAARGEGGELRIAFTMYTAWGILPDLLAAFAQTYPEVVVKLDETLPRDLKTVLRSGDADIGISFPTPVTESLRCMRITREPLCAVIPESHPLAGCEQLNVGQLATEKFITFPGTTAPELHDAIMATCRHDGFEPRIHLETHLQQTIVNLVARGLGVSLVPDSMRRLRLDGAIFKTLASSAQVEQGVFWNTRNSNPCLNSFLDTAGVWYSRLQADQDAEFVPFDQEPGL